MIKPYTDLITRYEEKLEKLKDVPCSLGAQVEIQKCIDYCKEQIELITKKDE